MFCVNTAQSGRLALMKKMYKLVAQWWRPLNVKYCNNFPCYISSQQTTYWPAAQIIVAMHKSAAVQLKLFQMKAFQIFSEFLFTRGNLFTASPCPAHDPSIMWAPDNWVCECRYACLLLSVTR